MFKDYARITTSMAKNSVIETFEVDTVMAKNTHTIVFLILIFQTKYFVRFERLFHIQKKERKL